MRLAYTIPEAAEQLSIGVSTVYELLAKGHLQAFKIGKSTRITHEALTTFIELSSVRTPA